MQLDPSKKGQTSVEYLLLVAVVVGVSILVSNVFGPRLVGVVQQVVESVQNEAWSGGEDSSVNANRPYQAYYSNNQGICMHSNKDTSVCAP